MCIEVLNIMGRKHKKIYSNNKYLTSHTIVGILKISTFLLLLYHFTTGFCLYELPVYGLYIS